jgi:GxxExxY protein
MEEQDPLTGQIIGCAIEVHRQLGPGLLEKPYETALCIALARAGLRFERQRLVKLIYEGVHVGDYYPDLIVEGEIVVEIKSVLQVRARVSRANVDVLAHHRIEARPDSELQQRSTQGGD